MNNKKVEHSLWEEPKLECISLSAADVITTSGGGSSDSCNEKTPFDPFGNSNDPQGPTAY